jgi:hypothetical protein
MTRSPRESGNRRSIVPLTTSPTNSRSSTW